jgi:hypothetical protein
MKIERGRVGLGNVDDMRVYQKDINGVGAWAKGPFKGARKEFKDVLEQKRLQYSIAPPEEIIKVKSKPRPATAHPLSTTMQRSNLQQHSSLQQQRPILQRRAWSAPAGRATPQQERPKTAKGDQSYSAWLAAKKETEKRDRTKWQDFNSLERSSSAQRPAIAKSDLREQWNGWNSSYGVTTEATYLAGIGELAPDEMTRSLELAASVAPSKAKRRLERAKDRYKTTLNKSGPFLRPGTTSIYTQCGWV